MSWSIWNGVSLLALRPNWNKYAADVTMDGKTRTHSENIGGQTLTQQESTPLIPREVLFGNPDKAAARLSPDGTLLSYLAPVDGVLNVWVGPADDPAAAKPVTSDTHRGIHAYFW
ncbi:MAG: S9 family peptidase, partial [Chloroflexi bacterium]|nr:S9 family peptidase [Chloroflexota bacterium]